MGHAERGDKAGLDRQFDAGTRNSAITLTSGGKRLAVATVCRNMESLRSEVASEKAIGGEQA
ncbi:MAG: hypothetical protein ACR2G6_11755 [Gemmatimonadaceae bacterium]